VPGKTFLSNQAEKSFDDIADRAIEELITDGNMLFSSVDADIRFGKAIRLENYLRVFYFAGSWQDIFIKCTSQPFGG
jgi:hypothetical protein